jgi:hypothetical protein
VRVQPARARLAVLITGGHISIMPKLTGHGHGAAGRRGSVTIEAKSA